MQIEAPFTYVAILDVIIQNTHNANVVYVIKVDYL